MPFAGPGKPFRDPTRPPPPPTTIDGQRDDDGAPMTTPPVYQDPVMCSRHAGARAVSAIASGPGWRLMCEVCLALWGVHHVRQKSCAPPPKPVVEDDEPPF